MMSGKKVKDAVGSLTDPARSSRPSSSEVIKDAKRWCVMKEIQTKRPITPRDPIRSLYGSSPRKGSRPPSSYSIGMQSFDPTDDSSRPGSVTTVTKSRLAPLPHIPTVPLNGEPTILSTKRNRRYSSSSSKKNDDPTTTLFRENSDLMRPKAVQDRTSAGSSKGEETPDEALYWNKSILPLLEHLEGCLSEQIIKEKMLEMCQTTQSLLKALETGQCFKQMSSRRRTSLLSTLFRLLNVQSRELHILCSKIILEMRIRNKNLTNVCKLVFTICREGKYDNFFVQFKVIGSMLHIFRNTDDILTKYEKYEAFVYLTGSFKCLSDNEEIARELLGLGFIQDLTDFMISCLNTLKELGDEKKPRKYAESLMVQVCSAFCNMLNVDQKMVHTIRSLPVLLLVFQVFLNDYEIVAVISRIFSKLTMFKHTFASFFDQKQWTKVLLRALSMHYRQPDVCIHLTLVLGDLTSHQDLFRTELYLCDNFAPADSEFKCLNLLVNIIEYFVRLDGAIENNQSRPSGITSEQVNDALVKTVRVLAHLSIAETIGPEIACNETCVDGLIKLLEKFSVNSHEELIVNVLATLNNFSYYGNCDNLVLENRMKLAVLLSDLMLFDKMNLVSEVIRVFGNLTKFADVRDMLHQYKVSHMMVALLDSGERLIVYNACGVLVNMSVDRGKRTEIISENCSKKLMEVIRDFAPTEWRIGGVACQLLWNLASDPSFSPSDDLVQLLESFLTYTDVDKQMKQIADCKETLNYLRITWKEDFHEFAHPLLNKLKSGHFNLIPLDRPIDSDESGTD